MAEDVILSAKMSSDELLKSIDNTLQKCDAKFSNFVKHTNAQLDSIGKGATINMATNFNSQIDAMTRKIDLLQGKIDTTTKGIASGANISAPNAGTNINLNDLQQAQILSKDIANYWGYAAANAKKLNEQILLNTSSKLTTEEDKVNMLVLKRSLLLAEEQKIRAKIVAETNRATAAEQKNKIALAGKSYGSAMAMESASIQQRIDKIKALQIVQKNLSDTDVNYKAQIVSTNREIQNLQRANKAALTSGIELERHNNRLAESFKNLGRRVLFYVGLGALTGFVRQVYDIRGQYEMIERSIGVLIGSFQRGSELFRQVQEMALKSPMTVLDLTSSVKQLVAYGFEMNQITNTTRRLADISSALGVPMERLVYNLGQIKAQGVLTARDARDFANAGLAVVPKLAQMYSNLEGQIVTTADVYDRMSKKMVSYGDVMKVIYGLTDEGGMFFDFQAKQAETLKGQLSNLTDAWNMMLNQIGEGNDGLLKGSVSLTRQLFENWKTISDILSKIVLAYGSYKAAQLVINSTMGSGNIFIQRQIALDKQSIATRLLKVQTTRTLTAEEETQLALSRAITIEDYKNLFVKKNLTKQQALWMVSMGQTNTQMRTALIRMGLLSAAEIRSVVGLQGLARGFKLAALSIKSFGNAIKVMMITNPAFWLMAGVSALMAWSSQASQRADEMRGINKSLADNAKETVDEIKKYLDDNQPTIKLLSAASNAEAKKTWKSLREEIEKTSSSADYFVSSLLKISNVQERNEAAIEYLKVIKETADVLKSTSDLEVMTQDVGLWGIGGEGLVSDLKDYSDALRTFRETENKSSQDYAKLYLSRQEYAAEIKKTSALIIESLRSEGITMEDNRDKFIEAFNAIRQQIIKANPEFKGAGLDVFNIEMDKTIGSNEAAWGKFMTVLKNTSSEAFTSITQDGLDKWGGYNDKSNKEVRKGIDNALKTIKDSDAELYNTITKLIENTPEFKVRIGFTFNVNSLSDFAKDFSNRINAIPLNDEEKSFLEKFAPRSDDNLSEWVDSLQKANDEAQKQIADWDKAGGEQAASEIKRINKQVEARTRILKLYGQSANTEKATNAERKKRESELSKTIKSEITLINDLTSRYNELTKAGMSHGDALAFLGNQYASTIERVNRVLSKNGLDKLDISKFEGKDTTQLLDILKSQRNKLSKNAPTDVLKTLEIEIDKIEVKGKTYVLKPITDALKEELSNIKEKFELGAEIEANPNVGRTFRELFKINTEDFPKTAREAIDKMQIAINNAMGKKGYASFNLISTDIDDYAKKGGLPKLSDDYLLLVDAQKQARDMIQKEFVDTSKILDDYVAKYGDYSTKIQAIEVERLSNLSKLNSYYNTEQLRQTQEYQDRLFAINSMADKKTAEAKLNQFKDSELYVKMFQNLDYLSTSTIVNLKNGLAELQKSLSDLNPEQIKQVVEQQQKLDDELTSRNPFKGLIGNIKEYISLLKNRKKDEEEAIRAQNDYNQQENKVILLRDKLAKDDREKSLSKEQRSNLEGQLAMENQILASKKQQKDVAGEQISKAEKLMQVLGAQLFGAAQQIDFASKAITSVRDDLSSVGVDLGDNLNYAIDGFSKASEGISMAVQSLISGNVAGVIAGMVKATIGQGQIFAGLFGGNKKNEYDKLKKSLDGLIEALNNSIEKQKELISGVSGARAISYYKDAIKDNNALADSYRELAKTRAADGASWGSHSYAYRTNKALKDDWAEMTKLTGKSVKSVDDMFNLTADELELIQTKMPKAWSELDGTIRENLEGVIKTGEAAKELQEALSMSLVGISLDDLVSDFSNMFSSLDTTTQDFADNFEKYMRNAIIRTMVYGEEFQKDISDWYKSFQQAMSDEALSTAEKDMLKTRYDELVGKYQQRVKDLGLSGETTSQLSALQQGISQVSEATASALEAKINSIDAQGYLANTYRQQLISIGNMQLAVQSEILLRMQQGYQVQLAIQNILNGWSNNSGQAVRVQLIPT